MKFKSDIEVQAGLRDGSDDIGTAGQLLSSTGTITNWIDQAEVVAAGATRVLIACKNTSGGTITKGTPVYQTGNVGATDVIEIAEADALISTGYLPAIGLLETDLINNAFGHVVITGELLNIKTSPIDGVVPTTGDTIYLKSGGGLTLTKPTGEGNAIQNLGLVGKVSGGNSGSLTVASIMRQNDVPNLPTGKIWVGDGNTIVSDVVYLDETDGRMGIGMTSPGYKLDVSGDAYIDETLNIETTISGTLTYGYGGVGAGNLVVGGLNFASFTPGVITLMNQDTSISAGQDLGVLQFGGKDDATNGYANGQIICTTAGGAGTGNTGGGIFRFLLSGNATGSSPTERMRITSSGNVGIGTTSPSEKLEVTGPIGSTKLTGYKLIFTRNANNEIFTEGASSTLTLGTNSVERIRIDSIGNVGIGTTSPDSLLEIASDSVTDFLKLTSTGGGSTPIKLIFEKSTSEQGIIEYNRNGDLEIYNTDADGGVMIDGSASGGADLYVANTGNVGIGTTAPEAKLEIKKGSSGLTSVNSQADALFLQSSSSTGITIATPDANKSSIFFSSASRQIGARINWGYNDLLMTLGTATANASLALKSGNESEAVRILSNGNVGIGTTSPSTKLHISDATTPEVRIQDTTNNRYLSLYQNNSNSYIQSSLNSPLVFSTHGSNERMRITTSGNVGIGTTSPSEKLEISSTGNTAVRISTDGDAGDIPMLQLYRSSGAYGQVHYEADGGNNAGLHLTDFRNDANSHIIFNTQGDNERMRIEADGNVGIGTTSPSAPLHLQATTTNAFKINNSSNSSVSIVSDNTYLGLYPNNYIVLGRSTLAYADLMFAGDKKIRWNETDGTWYDVLYSSGTDNLIKFGSVTPVSTGGDTAFYHNSSEKMRLTSTGLGIGTTSPGDKLSIAGNMSTLHTGNATKALRVTMNSNDTFLSLYARADQSNQQVLLRTNGNSYLNGGNVGIGTTSPGSKLEVQGGDIEVDDSASGLILKSPDGTRYRITVANGGTLTVTAV